MVGSVEKMLEVYEDGRLTRRELAVRLAACALAMAGAKLGTLAAEPSSSTFRATGLNHIALQVTDLARSRDFYKEHLGLGVIRQSSYNCFMSCGDNFVALFRSDEPAMHHYCYTIEGYDPDAAMKTLRNVGLKPERQANRVYFSDPDGLTVQISGRRDAWPRP